MEYEGVDFIRDRRVRSLPRDVRAVGQGVVRLVVSGHRLLASQNDAGLRGILASMRSRAARLGGEARSIPMGAGPRFGFVSRCAAGPGASSEPPARCNRHTRAFIFEHPASSRDEHIRLWQVARLRADQQFLIRLAGPKEITQPAGEGDAHSVFSIRAALRLTHLLLQCHFGECIQGVTIASTVQDSRTAGLASLKDTLDLAVAEALHSFRMA